MPLGIQLRRNGADFAPESEGLRVLLTYYYGSREVEDVTVADGRILATVPATERVGKYGIEITGTQAGSPWRTKYNDVLNITDETVEDVSDEPVTMTGDYYDIVLTVNLYGGGDSAELLEELERLRGELASLTGELAEKDEVISQKDAVISLKDAVITQKDAVISEKDSTISGLEGDLQESQQQLEGMTTERDKAVLFIGSCLGDGADIEVPGIGKLNIRYGALEVPAGFTEIGDSTFRSKLFVDSIDFGDVETIGSYACYECTNLKSVDGRNVQRIYLSAFYGCTSLVYVNLPNLREVGQSAFYNCRSLEVISLPELTTSAQYMFYGNTSLKTVNLPKMTIAPAYMFFNCSALEELVLPMVGSISSAMFNANCTSLKKLDFAVVNSITQPINIDSIETIILRRPSMATLSQASHINNTCTVYVPDELVEEYKAATNWKNHAGQIRGLSEYVDH